LIGLLKEKVSLSQDMLKIINIHYLGFDLMLTHWSVFARNDVNRPWRAKCMPSKSITLISWFRR